MKNKAAATKNKTSTTTTTKVTAIRKKKRKEKEQQQQQQQQQHPLQQQQKQHNNDKVCLTSYLVWPYQLSGTRPGTTAVMCLLEAHSANSNQCTYRTYLVPGTQGEKRVMRLFCSSTLSET